MEASRAGLLKNSPLAIAASMREISMRTTPPRTQVQVADFTVSHLAVREADELLARAKQGVRVVAQQPVIVRLASHRNRVAMRLGPVPPAVKNGEQHWAVLTHRSLSLLAVDAAAAKELRGLPELFLDAQQLIVFGYPVRA